MDAVQKALRIAKQEGGPMGDNTLSDAQNVNLDASAPLPTDAGGDVFYTQNKQSAFDPNAYVTGLYKEILNRNPDVGGLADWTGSLAAGRRPEDIRQEFLASPENTVQDLYSILLQRGTLDPGASGWINAVQSGTMTPAQVRDAILQSEEYRGLTGGGTGGAGGGGETGGGTAQTPTTKQTGQFADKPTSSSRMMPLIYRPPPYKDYGATTSAYRVAYGLENLPEGFRSYSPTLPNQTQEIDAAGNPIISNPYANVGQSDLYNRTLKDLLSGGGTKTGGGAGGGGGGAGGGAGGGTGGGGAGLTYANDIANLYKTYLGREPEAGIISAWDNQIKTGQLSFADVLNQIKGSPEGQVYQAYTNLLGRRPEEGASTAWINQIASGQLTPQQFQQAITSSPEYVSNQISQAYQTYLKRTPSASEVNSWAQNVTGGGMSLADVIAYISGSPEARGYNTGGAVKEYAEGGGTTYEDLVRAAYKGFLYRDPDEGGFKDWLGALESGAIQPQDFESAFKGAGYEDDVINAYQKYLNRLPRGEEVGSWVNTIQAGMPLYEFIQSVQKSPEATSRSYYENVPDIYKKSEAQEGRVYDIDIGRVERTPRLEMALGPVNLVEEYQKFLNAEKGGGASGIKNVDDVLYGKNTYGGGDGGSNFGAQDPSGTAGAIQSDPGGGAQGPSGVGEGTSGLWARGGRIGNNAIDNAIRMIKADRR